MDRADDPRARSSKYSKGGRTSFNESKIDFAPVHFIIDDNYTGDPPKVQVSIENLNDNIDENFLKKDLAKLGRIRTLEIIRNPKTGQHLGLAKVEFEDVSVAQACVDNFNRKHIMGRQLNVYKDIRFAIIEQAKEAKLNPWPIATQKQQQLQQQQIQQPPPPPPPLLANLAPISTTTPTLPTNNAYNAHLNLPPQSTTHHPHVSKTSSLGPTPSPISIEYASTTPGSVTNSSTTAESMGRQRLEDRIAILMKRPDCVLSAIVAPAAPQASPTYSAFKDTSYDYGVNSSFDHQPQQQSTIPARISDKARRSDVDDQRRIDYGNNQNRHPNQNHRDSHQGYDIKNDYKTDRYSHKNSIDDWDPPKKKEEPLNIQLTEEQIENEVIPFCYREFYAELTDNLITTILKKLREKHGYQCLERAQTEFKAYRDKKKIQAEIERIKREEQLQYERRYMSREKVEQPVEAPRPKVHLQRTTIQDSRRRTETDLRRVNRSSAYMVEPERRGSHTSVDSDFSDSESSASAFSSSSSSSGSSSSSSSSSNSSQGSRSSSRSSSSPSSRSSSPDSRSSRSGVSDSSDEELVSAKSRLPNPEKDQSFKNDFTKSSLDLAKEAQRTTGKSSSESEAIEALLNLQYSSSNNKKLINEPNEKIKVQVFPDEDDDEVVKKPPKVTNKKRKNKVSEVLGVASEYRAAKRFASGHTGSHDENIENAIYDDENLIDDKPESKFIYPERSAEEKKRLLDDLFGLLSEEDVKYLAQVHAEAEQHKDRSKVAIPFGSEMANKVHLNMKKHMIEGKAAEGHPKWWRGCSRCDVIKVSEKGKTETEEVNFEDLTRAPIKSHVIQAATSSRRDQRGDQRRMAVMNANIDADYLKCYQTSTLQVSKITHIPLQFLMQLSLLILLFDIRLTHYIRFIMVKTKMRAKNLRFSRSKIHKWGLFACEKIASGDAVIEYVGEKIRPSLADHREKEVYAKLPTHDGSSYFFRVDYDVIDATLKGNKARFINHSCNVSIPN